MDETQIKLYFAYTSPYTYLAWEPTKALERSHRVRVRFVPFGVNIRRVYDDVPIRSERNRHKLHYLYLDARRMAKERGVVIYPPKKIFSARFAFYGGMCAEDQGRFVPYSDRVFERFWRRELEVESPDALAAILEEVGADPAPFRSYIRDRTRRRSRGSRRISPRPTATRSLACRHLLLRVSCSGVTTGSTG